MAIKVGGVTVINDSRGLENITSGLSKEVRTPVITFPVNGATGFDAIDAPNIKVISPYFSLYGLTKKGTEVQISVNSDFSFPIINDNEVGTDTTFNYDNTTYSFATSTLYYIRVRHYDVDDNYSDWSTSVSFTTPASFIFVNQPSITSPSNNAVDLLGNPTITSSAFATTPTEQDTHTSSDWQVATDASFTTIVDSSTADTLNLTSYSVQTELANATVHYVRVRHNGATYTSAWSDAISFTTAAQYVWYGMATNSSVTTYGDSYQNFLAAFTDGAGNKSVIAVGNPNSTNVQIHRYSNELDAQGKITFTTPSNYSYVNGLAAYKDSSGAYNLGAIAGFDSSNNPRINFLDLRNGGITHYGGYDGGFNAFTLNGGYWISNLRSAGNTLLLGTGYSSAGVPYVFYFYHAGMAAEQKITLSGASTAYGRDVLRLSDGKIAVVGEHRDSSNNSRIFLVIFNNSNLNSVYSSHTLTPAYGQGNNQFVTELANGNLIVGDWDIVMEVNISTSTPSIVNYVNNNSNSRVDKAWEDSQGNIVWTNSQTSPQTGNWNPSDWSNGATRNLVYSTTREWFNSVLSDENAIYAAGRWYTGSAYQGFITKSPADVSQLDSTGTPFPSLTQWSWADATPTQASGIVPVVSAVTATLGSAGLGMGNYAGAATAASLTGITKSTYD